MQESSVYEREIDLVQMIKYLIKKFPIMLVGAVFGLILFLVLSIVLNSGTEIVEEGELTSFEKQQKKYEQDYAQLEMEIADLEQAIEEQSSYNSESLLMKMNPYNKQSVSGQFYIDTDYKINPELSYQDTDLTTSIARAYEALETTGTLANYINERIDEPIKERYLNELIDVTYLGDATLRVVVMHTSQEEAKQIYDLVMECMEEKKNEFVKTIGNYSITLLNESDKASVDIELSNIQTSNLESINTLKESLEEKQESFDSLVEPVESTVSLIFPIIGGVLGGICVFGVYVVLFLLNTTLKTSEDVVHFIGLPVLGNVPIMEGTKATVEKEKRNCKKRYLQYGNNDKKEV